MKLWIIVLEFGLFAQLGFSGEAGVQSLYLNAALVLANPVGPVTEPAHASLHHLNGAAISLGQLQNQMNKGARRLSKKGMRKFFQQKYAEALPLLQQAALQDPRSSVLENNLGVAYCSLGRDKEAQKSFQQALEIDSTAVTSYINLAAVAFNTHQYGLAEMSARQALRLTPSSAEAGVMLGLAEVAQGQWTTEARHFLEETRASFRQAETVLENWPPDDNRLIRSAPPVRVRRAGEGAFARAPATPTNARPLTR